MLVFGVSCWVLFGLCMFIVLVNLVVWVICGRRFVYSGVYVSWFAGLCSAVVFISLWVADCCIFFVGFGVWVGFAG